MTYHVKQFSRYSAYHFFDSKSSQCDDHVYQQIPLCLFPQLDLRSFHISSLFFSSKCVEWVEEDTGEAAARLRLDLTTFLIRIISIWSKTNMKARECSKFFFKKRKILCFNRRCARANRHGLLLMTVEASKAAKGSHRRCVVLFCPNCLSF